MAAAPNKILGNKLQSVRALAIQTGILIHEVDEGSPCLKCGDKCKNGFSLHYWRKVCANCHCPREEHDVRPHHDEKHTTTNVGKILFHPTIINEAAKSPKRHRSPIAGAKQLESPSDTPSILRKTHNFTWTPKDCSVDAAKSYFEGLPINKKPISSTPGDRYWQKQKIRQLPAHDIDLIYCNELSDEECKQMELFVKIRREKFLGRANVTTKQSDSVHTICCECNVPFKVGEAFLTADKLPNKFWHPSCFMCSKCKELLIEMIYFVHEGKLYCGRDHAEQLKPRCAACDEV
jgi:prickle